MTKALLATVVVLALGCGGPEPNPPVDTGPERIAETTEQATDMALQDSIRPPEGWVGQPGGGPSVTELTLGRRPDGPWKFQPRFDDPEWDASLPTDWSADPFEDLNWQHHLHSWRSMELTFSELAMSVFSNLP